MKATYAINTAHELEARAAEALKAALMQVSTIQLKDLKLKAREAGQRIGILARIVVLGQDHTLACKVMATGEPQSVRKALLKLQNDAAHLPGRVTPVCIAPYLPPEAQSICAECKAGFLGLDEDLVRLNLGEVFISKRSLNPRHPQAVPSSPNGAIENPSRKFPPTRAAAPAGACGAEALGCA